MSLSICRKLFNRETSASNLGRMVQGECAMPKSPFCVVLTGAASGLGAASAIALANEGARLVLNYLANRQGAEQTAETCRRAGAEVVIVQGDVASDADCKRI